MVAKFLKGVVRRCKSRLSFCDFTTCEIINAHNNYPGTKTVQVRTLRIGQGLKYLGGWSSANKRIYLSESTHECWRSLRAALVFGAERYSAGTFMRVMDA